MPGSVFLAALGMAAILAAVAGLLFRASNPRAAHWLTSLGYLGMAGTVMLVVVDVAARADRSDAALMMGKDSVPDLTVSGSETIVPMAPDGHFWVEARVNGTPHDFLIDTGATVTGLSRPLAAEAGVSLDPSRLPYQVDTANGTIWVTPGKANSFAFGSISARNLEVGVPRDFDDDTNVIGMNLLSQLASWRVEGKKLILRPRSEGS